MINNPLELIARPLINLDRVVLFNTAVYSIWNEIIAGVNDPHFARGDEKEKEKEGFHRRNETSGQTLRYSFLIIVRVVTDTYGSMEHSVAIRYFQFAEHSVRYICSVSHRASHLF